MNKNERLHDSKLPLQLKDSFEADEFSFVGEHIEDEPSIHIKSLSEFQTIPSNLQIFFISSNFSLERP